MLEWSQNARSFEQATSLKYAKLVPILFARINTDRANRLGISLAALGTVSAASSAQPISEFLTLMFLLVPPLADSSEVHKIIYSCCDDNVPDKPLAEMGKQVQVANRKQLSKVNTYLDKIGMSIGLQNEGDATSAMVDHIFESRSSSLPSIGARVKCSISTCQNRVTNSGVTFCINCTMIFAVGGSGNGICQDNHCKMVHRLTRNIEAIVRESCPNFTKNNSGSSFTSLY